MGFISYVILDFYTVRTLFYPLTFQRAIFVLVIYLQPYLQISHYRIYIA